jgi:hypothetical protein
VPAEMGVSHTRVKQHMCMARSTRTRASTYTHAPCLVDQHLAALKGDGRQLRGRQAQDGAQLPRHGITSGGLWLAANQRRFTRHCAINVHPRWWTNGVRHMCLARARAAHLARRRDRPPVLPQQRAGARKGGVVEQEAGVPQSDVIRVQQKHLV